MNSVMRTRLALSSLSIYRNVLNDGVMTVYLKMLEAVNGVEVRGFLESYGEFFACLAACGEINFTRYLVHRVQYDDNIFSRQAAGRSFDDISSTVVEAANRDIEAFQKAAGLASETIKTVAAENFAEDSDAVELIGNLPKFETGMQDDEKFIQSAEEAAAFYRTNGCGVFARYGAFKWQRGRNGESTLFGINEPDPVTLDDLKGYEYERGVVLSNTIDFLDGLTANNLLLYGDRGTGKSSTVKAVFNKYRKKGLRIIEVSKDSIVDFTYIVQKISEIPLKFIIFIDDLSFTEDDDNYSALKAVLEGGLAARPKNSVIYATSNRRHFIKESFAERDRDDVHAEDAMQEKLSLADRFGITVTFSSPDQRHYFEIVHALADDRKIEIGQLELERGAVQWALRFNGRSPRTARQYIDWVESRVKKGQPVIDF